MEQQQDSPLVITPSSWTECEPCEEDTCSGFLLSEDGVSAQPCPKATARASRRRLEGILGKRFASRTFDSWELKESNASAYERCREWAMEYDPGVTETGLLLVGPVGTGKTHLAAAVLHEVVDRGFGHGAMMTTVADLLAMIRSTYDGQNHDDFLQAVGFGSLVVLDDLGAEKPSDWVREQLYVLMNRRYEACLPTIITTNVAPSELAAVYGARLMDRVVEMTNRVTVGGDSHRVELWRRRRA